MDYRPRYAITWVKIPPAGIGLFLLTADEYSSRYWPKRLEQGQFSLPWHADEIKRGLSRTALLALLEGMDIEIKRQRKRYKRAA
jgi:hypothetical protein